MLTWKCGGQARPPAVIDEAFLARLAEHIGAGPLRELLSDGLLEITDRLERLDEAASTDRRALALRIGHDIAGLAGHIGLSALSKAAVEMNRTAREEPVHLMSALAAPVLAAGETATEALRRRILEDAERPGTTPGPDPEGTRERG